MGQRSWYNVNFRSNRKPWANHVLSPVLIYPKESRSLLSIILQGITQQPFSLYFLIIISNHRPAALPVGEKAGPMPFLLFTYRKFFLILSCLFISERCVGQ